MEGDLKTEARSAVVGAAERLGVDPFRLARFLSNGRLADILTRLRGEQREGRDRAGHVNLAEQYLDFLDQEIALRGGRTGTSRGGDAGRSMD
jgi:hypothetical protein